jgi:hypothetical protein
MVGAAIPGGGDGAWLNAWPDVPPVRRCVLPALACAMRVQTAIISGGEGAGMQ